MNEEKSRVRDAILDAAEYAGVEIREDYSGRAMYGERCIGIVGDVADLVRVVAEAQAIVTQEAEEDSLSPLTSATRIPGPKSDSMGREAIFYWPDLRVD